MGQFPVRKKKQDEKNSKVVSKYFPKNVKARSLSEDKKAPNLAVIKLFSLEINTDGAWLLI